MISIAQAEELRRVVLEHLAARYPLAYTADAICRMLIRRQVIDFAPTASEMAAALAYLRDEALAVSNLDPLDAIPTWQATSKGVAYIQRRQVQDNPEEGVRR